MTYTDAAIAVTRRAEDEVRGLIEKATREGLYQEISMLAALAQGLAGLRVSLGDKEGKLEESAERTRLKPSSLVGSTRSQPDGPHRSEHKKASVRPRPSRVTTEVRYPRFIRDSDKLVKIGWSERDGCTYEHRSPLEVVRAFVQKLVRFTKTSDTVRMEDLLPIQLGGNDVPSYQAYMALAWLRSLGLVERSSKNSYVIEKPGELMRAVDRAWEGLPSAASELREKGRD